MNFTKRNRNTAEHITIISTFVPPEPSEPLDGVSIEHPVRMQNKRKAEGIVPFLLPDPLLPLIINTNIHKIIIIRINSFSNSGYTKIQYTCYCFNFLFNNQLFSLF